MSEENTDQMAFGWQRGRWQCWKITAAHEVAGLQLENHIS
jgi:hypothetical protein